ncbi:hypothetical protein FQA47_015468 [Oryzias melastigma]|uniref:Uncharacterized protein n=1 Tax=Oryzias melastigma TaxID=30732 RepID=A0A834L066_ORYME|nr:hypothetical protein FQA47_015468 [Oryzias melastigma]
MSQENREPAGPSGATGGTAESTSHVFSLKGQKEAGQDQVRTGSGPSQDRVRTESGLDQDQVMTGSGPDRNQIKTGSGLGWGSPGSPAVTRSCSGPVPVPVLRQRLLSALRVRRAQLLSGCSIQRRRAGLSSAAARARTLSETCQARGHAHSAFQSKAPSALF